MTDPVLEDDVVVPLRMQSVVARPGGRQDRWTGVVAIALVGFVGIAVILGATNIGGPQRLPPMVFATSEPTPAPATPRPTPRITPLPSPKATPLPEHLVLGGRIPDERLLVATEGVHVLNVKTGRLGQDQFSWEDRVFAISASELVCICVVRGTSDTQTGSIDLTLRFRRSGLDGNVKQEADVATITEITPIPDMNEGFNVQAAISADNRRVVVLLAWRKPPSWTIQLYEVDAETGETLSARVLDTLPTDLDNETPTPTPTPTSGGGRPASDGVYVWANTVALTTDGLTAFASVNYSEVRNDNWSNQFKEWMVPLDSDAAAIPLAEDARFVGDGWCFPRSAFMDDALLVQICSPPTQGPFFVRRLRLDGTAAEQFPTGSAPRDGYVPMPLIDATTRQAFIWYPGEHQITRINLDNGQTIVADVPDSMLPDGGGSVNRGYAGGEPMLALSPDGRRVYALGTSGGGPDIGGSSGVWVFDTATLELLDHWEPRALLNSITVSSDGQYVYAAGAPDYDPNGRFSGWQASLTVYDALTGEIQVIHGQIGARVWINFFWW